MSNEEKSIFESINVLFVNKINKLDFNIKKTKGKVELIDFLPNEKTKDEKFYYEEAKNLEPFGQYKFPYWNFYYLVADFGFGVTNLGRYHDYFLKATTELYRKFLPVSVFNNMKKEVPFTSWEFYESYIKRKRSKINSLFISNDLSVSGIEDFFIFREKNSEYSYEDNVKLFELSNYVLVEDRKYPVELRKDLLKKYDKIEYTEIKENLCDTKNLEKYINSIDEKLDLISINVLLFLWELKRYKSYLSSQIIFNLLILVFQKIKKTGVLKIQIDNLNCQIIFDIVAILNYYFEEVYIFKSSAQNKMVSYKDIICENFKGIDTGGLEKLKILSEKWLKIEKKCNIDNKGIKEDKYYIRSILGYKNNYDEYRDFQNLEISNKIDVWKKIVNAYYFVKEKGEKAEEELIQKKLYRTMVFCKIHNIDEKIKTNKIEKSILLNDNELNLKLNFRSFSLNEKNPSLNFSVLKKRYELEKLHYSEGRLRSSFRVLDSISEKDYENITKEIKEFGYLKTIVSNNFSLTSISQAFLKLYEILTIFDLLKIKSEVHRTYHLCEAPGQFILATNHYLKTKTNNKIYDWNAQSMNPKNKNFLQDTYKLIKKYKERWDFGLTNSGDITETKNIEYYSKQLENRDLVTFDCGFSFNTKTLETYQDRATAKINFDQIFIILNGISLGTNVVIKVFLPQSINYIVSLNYILYCCFKELFIYKSFLNPSSSEIYIICKNFTNKLSNSQLKKLEKIRSDDLKETGFVKIPKDFLEEYQENLNYFIQKNIDAITRINYYYNNKDLLENKSFINQIKKKNATKWIKNFDIEKINKSDVLI